MNRKKLLALARKQGFSGEETLDALTKFLTEKGIELQTAEGEAVDLKAVWAVEGTKKVVLADDDTDDLDDADPGSQAVSRKATFDAEQKAAGNGSGRKIDASNAGSTKLGWEAKAYDRKAARGETVFDDSDTAAQFGAWVRLKVTGGGDYSQKSNDLAILRKTQVEYNNLLGGNLVPVEFVPNLIRIREQYGVASRVMSAFPMSRDVVQVPRELNDVVVYGVNEGNSATESDLNWDLVSLTAFKIMTMSRISSELLNDAAVSVSDRIANSIAFAYANKEDECLFNGDGTATYFGVNGIRNSFRKLVEDNGGTWTTDGDKDNCAGLVLADGNAWSEITLANVDEVASRLPTTFERGAAWYCHKRFFMNVMLRLDTLPTASVTAVARDFALGDAPRLMWRGYPVVFVQVMPRAEGNSEIPLLFGDLNAGAKFGRVSNSFEIATSDQRYFDQDLIAIRSKQRLAMTVHDIGDYNSSAASQNPGPICGLVTKNA